MVAGPKRLGAFLGMAYLEGILAVLHLDYGAQLWVTPPLELVGAEDQRV